MKIYLSHLINESNAYSIPNSVPFLSWVLLPNVLLINWFKTFQINLAGLLLNPGAVPKLSWTVNWLKD